MARIYAQADISRVQQANDIVDVISEHLTLTKRGREMLGLCPFHEDHRPSLYVNPAKQIFKCFACSAGGNVFSFLQMRENLTFVQAVERLAQRAGIEIKAERTFAKSNTQNDADPNDLARANTWADKFFQKYLNDKEKGQTARQYLAERKISPDSIKKWHIGYAPPSGNDLVNAAKKSKIDDKLLLAAGLVKELQGSLTDKFSNRLMFIITDPTSRVIAFGGRTLDGVGAKYINSPTTALFDKSNCLYGLDYARDAINKTATAVVFEGYTDVIMSHQFGIENVVATLGTSFTEGHARILKRYAKSIILVYDSDTAGVEAANRALEICLSRQIDIKIASVPEGKDPCDYILSSGKDAFAEVIESAHDVFEFKWTRLLATFDSDNTIAGRKAAINEFLTSVAKAAGSGNIGVIEKGIIVNRLSKMMGIDNALLHSELSRKIKTARRADSYHVQNSKVVSYDLGSGLFAAAQKEIIEVLLNKPEFFEKVNNMISPKYFDIPALALAADAIFQTLNENPDAQLAEILTYAEDPQISSLLVELQQTGQQKENYEQRLKDSLAVFMKCLNEKQQSLENENLKIEDLAARAKKRNPYSLGMT